MLVENVQQYKLIIGNFIIKKNKEIVLKISDFIKNTLVKTRDKNLITSNELVKMIA